MNIRTYSGSVFGLNKNSLFRADECICMRLNLKEKPEHNRLQAAIDQALENCPYMKFNVVREEGSKRVWKYTDNDLPLPLHRELPEYINGTENNNHPALITVDDNGFSLYVVHVLTDLYGIMLFVRSVLGFYFDCEDAVYKGKDEPDYIYDPLEKEYPVEKEPDHIGNGEASSTFEPNITDSTCRYSVIRVNGEDIDRFCADNNASKQGVFSFLAAMTVIALYPGIKDDLIIRVPVNARNLLGTPNAFQNASHANVRLRIKAEELKSPDKKIILPVIMDQINEQTEKNAVFSQLNDTRRLIVEEDNEKRRDIIKRLINNDWILVSYLGKIIVGSEPEKRAKEAIVYCPFFPLAIYVSKNEKDYSLTISNGTGNKDFEDAFLNVLRDFGIRIF